MTRFVQYMMEGVQHQTSEIGSLQELFQHSWMLNMEGAEDVEFHDGDTIYESDAVELVSSIMAENSELNDDDIESLIGTVLETKGTFKQAFESSLYKVKNRVRGGGTKIQRKKRVSAKKGWTYDGKKKKANKIDAVSRLKMSKTAKRSALKRKASQSMANVRRKKSNRMRKSLGFDK